MRNISSKLDQKSVEEHGYYYIYAKIRNNDYTQLENSERI